MQLNRIHISEESRHKLSVLKARTGMLPNVLCRLGLTLSLEETSEPALDAATDGSEFNRFTLMGEWDPLIVGIVEKRCAANGNGKDNGALVKYFRAHLNRGVVLLYGRVKDVVNLENVLS